MTALRAAALTLTLATCWAPIAGAEPYPVAEGNYTSADDPGWVFFLSPPGYGNFGCGIGPDGTVGCDVVPHPVPISDEPPTDVPPDANQTVATPDQPGYYRHADALTFTRAVDVLPEGHQLVNGDASCLVGFQGSVSCTTGEHGFTHYAVFGYTH